MMRKEIHYRARLNTFSPRRPSFDEYVKIKDTPKGIIVVPSYIYEYCDIDSPTFKENTKRVLHDTINKLCYPTKEEALFALVKRSERRKLILSRQLRAVNEFLELGVDDSPEEVFKIMNIDTLLKDLYEKR